MNPRALLPLCIATFVAAAHPQDAPEPTLLGYVTRVSSNTDFDVNGFRVVCDAQTRSFRTAQSGEVLSNDGCPYVLPYLGEPVSIYGWIKKKKGLVMAAKVILQPVPPGEVSGAAVIDALPPRDTANAQPDTLLIRADGYRILLTGATEMVWSQSLRALADVKPGDWIRYRGRLDNFGLVVAASARLAPDAVGVREEKLRARNEYDPAAVPADAEQNPFREVLIGPDPKKFPPYRDAAMEARVEAIGNKLIPAYQRALPGSDPAKIHFRFQVIDREGFYGAHALPSGIILVSHQVVERMQNDAQLAAVLADSIACVLEKQEYRTQPEREAAGVGTAGGVVTATALKAVPLAAPILFAGAASLSAVEEKMLEQSGRVSLDLLMAAGYDIHQAPLAWWLLAKAKPKPVLDIPMPERTAYLYRMLGEEWRNATAPSAVAAIR